MKESQLLSGLQGLEPLLFTKKTTSVSKELLTTRKNNWQQLEKDQVLSNIRTI